MGTELTDTPEGQLGRTREAVVDLLVVACTRTASSTTPRSRLCST